METGLAGKRVLVTGGSGGIGAACARALMGEGARVAVHYHRGRERAEAVGAEVALGADLTDEAQVDALFEQACVALGGLDAASRSPVSGRAKTSPSGSSRSSAGRRRSART